MGREARKQFLVDGPHRQVLEVDEPKVRHLRNDSVEEKDNSHRNEKCPSAILDHCPRDQSSEVIENGRAEEDDVKL